MVSLGGEKGDGWVLFGVVMVDWGFVVEGLGILWSRRAGP